MVRTISCVVLLIGLACGGGGRRDGASLRPADPNRLLASVPADTPYVLAAIAPAPRPMQQFMARAFERTIAQFHASTAQLTTDDRRTLDAWTRFRLALVDDLRGKPAAGWLSALGIEVGAPFVLYGLGPWPAFRFQVSDPARVRAVLERALTQIRATSARVAGRPAWIIARGEFEVVLAILDRDGADPAQVVIALVPATARDRVLAPPPRALLATSVLSDVAARHKLSRVLHGYLDLRQTVSVLRSTTLDEPARRELAPLVAACGGELDRVAAAFPRVVVGYRAVDDVHFDATMVLEAPSKVTGALAKMRTPVPGVIASHTTGAMIAAGAALDIDAFVAWSKGIVSELRGRPFACPLLTWINDAANALDEVVGSPVWQLVRGGRGFAFSIDAIDPAAQSVTGDVLLVGDQIANLLGLVTSLVPALANLGLKPDGEPVELPVATFGIPWVSAAHVALRDDRIAVSFGPGSHDRVRARLGAKPPQRSPLATMSGNAERFGKALRALGRATEDDGDEIGDFAMHLDVTDAGIALDILGSW